jgi:hypothetical protein
MIKTKKMNGFPETQICPDVRDKVFGNLSAPGLFRLISGVGLNFFRFLRTSGLFAEKDLVILSPKDDYSYDEHEIRSARVLVNLKKLNRISHPDLFLRSLVFLLPAGTSFVGCFSDSCGSAAWRTRVRDLFRSLRRFTGKGRRGHHVFNSGEVLELLEKNGFVTINMKEMNGLTYFISRTTGLTA